MVHASTLIISAFAVAPVLSAPLSVYNKVHHSEVAEPRAIEQVSDLDLRDPKFNFGKILRGVGGFVKKVAVPAAGLLLRDVDGNLIEARELGLTAEPTDLDARRFNFKKLLSGGLKVVGTAAKLLIRDAEGNYYVRDLETDDLTERDLDLVDLDTREPINFRRILGKVGGVAGHATRIAGTVANIAGGLLLRDEDSPDLDARDVYFLDLSDLSERDLAELDVDLDSREPFRLGNLVRKVGGIAGKVSRVASLAGGYGFGLRDLEDDGAEVDARDAYYAIDEDLLEREVDDWEELDARDPKFRFGSVLRRVGGVAKQAVGVAGHVANFAGSLGLRELDDEFEVEARSFEDLD